MNLPEKKAAVFRAVLKLLRQGRPLGDLKVSEIAEAAGIGKGTVYEYFPSREELLRETRGELCELSLAIAEKVIHVSLNSSSEVVARMIQVATEKLKRREWVHIYVGGCTAKEVSAITPELMTALAGLSDHIKIIPLSDDEAGTCIIEMPDEIIDASASTQLKNIRDLIHEI